MRAKTLLLWTVVLLVGLEQLWLLFPVLKDVALPPQQDPAEAGRMVAQDLGCFSCHGPGGAVGIDNPGSEDGVVPALAGGEMMMWADNEQEVREWILYGRPLEEEGEEEQDTREGLDAGRGSDRAIVMPAFEPYLGAGQLDELIAYLGAISGLQFPEEQAAANGLEELHKHGCFNCHGPMGTGGVANPGSLKGYVPGFFGPDYGELVNSGEELSQWISEGVTERIRENPIAAAILERQALKMPAYGRFLDEAEIAELAAAVEWLVESGWRKTPVP